MLLHKLYRASGFIFLENIKHLSYLNDSTNFHKDNFDLFTKPRIRAISIKSASCTKHIGRIIVISNLRITNLGGIVLNAPWKVIFINKVSKISSIWCPKAILLHPCSFATVNKAFLRFQEQRKQGDFRVSVLRSKSCHNAQTAPLNPLSSLSDIPNQIDKEYLSCLHAQLSLQISVSKYVNALPITPIEPKNPFHQKELSKFYHHPQSSDTLPPPC